MQQQYVVDRCMFFLTIFLLGHANKCLIHYQMVLRRNVIKPSDDYSYYRLRLKGHTEIIILRMISNRHYERNSPITAYQHLVALGHRNYLFVSNLSKD